MEYGLEIEIEERVKREIRIRFSKVFNNLSAEGYTSSIIIKALNEFVAEVQGE